MYVVIKFIGQVMYLAASISLLVVMLISNFIAGKLRCGDTLVTHSVSSIGVRVLSACRECLTWSGLCPTAGRDILWLFHRNITIL